MTPPAILTIRASLEEIFFQCEGRKDITDTGTPNLAMRVYAQAQNMLPALDALEAALRQPLAEDKFAPVVGAYALKSIASWLYWNKGRCGCHGDGFREGITLCDIHKAFASLGGDDSMIVPPYDRDSVLKAAEEAEANTALRQPPAQEGRNDEALSPDRMAELRARIAKIDAEMHTPSGDPAKGTTFREFELLGYIGLLLNAAPSPPAPASRSEALDPEMPAQELRLHMGEITASEMRVARAAIRWANSVRDGAEGKP